MFAVKWLSSILFSSVSIVNTILINDSKRNIKTLHHFRNIPSSNDFIVLEFEMENMLLNFNISVSAFKLSEDFRRRKYLHMNAEFKTKMKTIFHSWGPLTLRIHAKKFREKKKEKNLVWLFCFYVLSFSRMMNVRWNQNEKQRISF